MPKLPVPFADEEPEEQTEAELHDARLIALFARAMAGQLGGDRAKKYYENARLNPRHLRMIQMKAAGFKNIDIAETFGMTQARVSVILKQPDAQYLLSALVGLASDEVIDVATRIKALAGEMLSTVVETTRNTNDLKLKSKNAFQLLAMAGYSAVEKKQVEIVPSIEGGEARQLMTALEEAMELDRELGSGEISSEGRYTMLASAAIASEERPELEEEEPMEQELEEDAA